VQHGSGRNSVRVKVMMPPRQCRDVGISVPAAGADWGSVVGRAGTVTFATKLMVGGRGSNVNVVVVVDGGIGSCCEIQKVCRRKDG
jgi:predicted RNA-binding protein YlqC (UPF0109 family)